MSNQEQPHVHCLLLAPQARIAPAFAIMVHHREAMCIAAACCRGRAATGYSQPRPGPGSATVGHGQSPAGPPLAASPLTLANVRAAASPDHHLHGRQPVGYRRPGCAPRLVRLAARKLRHHFSSPAVDHPAGTDAPSRPLPMLCSLRKKKGKKMNYKLLLGFLILND